MWKEILAIKKGNKVITLEDRGYDRQNNARLKKKRRKEMYCWKENILQRDMGKKIYIIKN